MVIPTWNFKVEYTPGLVVDYEFVELGFYSDPIPINYFSDVYFEMYVDNKRLFDTETIQSQSYSFEFDDSTPASFELKFKIQGLSKKRLLRTQHGQDAVPVIMLDIRVEDLKIISLWEEYAKYYTDNGSIKMGARIMGEDGEQTLQVHTPIWPWLLSHKKLITQDILNEFSQKN